MDLRERAALEGVRHPWERYRFAFYYKVIVEAFERQSISVLDVGAGDGWFAQELCAAWDDPLDIALWDSGYIEGQSIQDGLLCIKSQPERTFDLVLMLDVVEHVSDDVGFLRNVVQRNLALDGKLLFSVPAYMWLWTSHDDRLMHRRRYSPKEAHILLEAAGLRVLKSGGLFPILLPLRALQMMIERILNVPVSGLEGAPRGIMAMLIEGLMGLDHKIAQGAALGLKVPGLSWWALCGR